MLLYAYDVVQGCKQVLLERLSSLEPQVGWIVLHLLLCTALAVSVSFWLLESSRSTMLRGQGKCMLCGT
jgi:hypothetical protein